MSWHIGRECSERDFEAARARSCTSACREPEAARARSCTSACREPLFTDSASFLLALCLASERSLAAWNFALPPLLPKLTPASGSSANDTCSRFQGLAFFSLRLDFLGTIVFADADVRRAGSGGMADLGCAALTAMVLAVFGVRLAGTGGLAGLSCAARSASCGLPLAIAALAAGVA